MEGLRSSGHGAASDVRALSNSFSKGRGESVRRPPTRQLSPDEISGPTPQLSPISPTTTAALEKISNQYSNPKARPMGFRNGPSPEYPSQVCYRNAAISMLLNLPYFTNWLRRDEEFQRSSQNTAFDSLRRLAEEYWSHDVQVEGGESPIDAINAKQERLDYGMDDFWNHFSIATGIKRPAYNIYAQDDAYFFLTAVFNLAYCELISTDRKVLEGIFKHHLASSTFCRERCYEKRMRLEKLGPSNWFHHVPFGSPSSIAEKAERTFQECFDASLKQEQSGVRCHKCKKSTDRSVREEFFDLPKILLTQFSRLTSEGIKIEDPCKIPLELTVPIDISVREAYNNPRYRLVGVVAHSGLTAMEGHYISYVRDPAREGGWIELNDHQARTIEFAEVNHNTAPRKEEMLPYIMAWELIQDSAEGPPRSVAPETEEHRLIRELAEKAKALEERQERLERLEDALNTREGEVGQMEEALSRQETKIKADQAALNQRNKELEQREKALNQREAEVEQREQHPQVKIKKEPGDSKHKKSILICQFDQSGKTPIEQEIDERKDTATFCASFRNADNQDENARAIFKLNNFDPNVPTRIESTVQLSDLEGDLRAIKKGTTVADGFVITFNVKGGRKRKGEDGDEAGLLTRPRKKPRAQPQRSSGEIIRLPRDVTPPGPRRSTRPTKGKHSRRP